jgi:hypothetical protein
MKFKAEICWACQRTKAMADEVEKFSLQFLANGVTQQDDTESVNAHQEMYNAWAALRTASTFFQRMCDRE